MAFLCFLYAYVFRRLRRGDLGGLRTSMGLAAAAFLLHFLAVTTLPAGDLTLLIVHDKWVVYGVGAFFFLQLLVFSSRGWRAEHGLRRKGVSRSCPSTLERKFAVIQQFVLKYFHLGKLQRSSAELSPRHSRPPHRGIRPRHFARECRTQP